MLTKRFYFIGRGLQNTLSPVLHNYIASVLGLPWELEVADCPTPDDALSLLQQSDFSGAVVTMPYKQTVIAKLDKVDDVVQRIGACNIIWRDDNGLLSGSNVDWIGIGGSLKSYKLSEGSLGLVIGAGGAARAALESLITLQKCRTIYIVNRDKREVEGLFKDLNWVKGKVEIIHVGTLEAAEKLSTPSYVIGTVPDMPPSTADEILCHSIIEKFLSKPGERGIVLDMCYKPRRTSLLKLAQKYHWTTIDGTNVIGHQIQEHCRLLYGEGIAEHVPMNNIWELIHQSGNDSI